MPKGIYERTGENNPNWKGNNIKNLTVVGIHNRIKNLKLKPDDGKCAICNQVADKKGITKLELSNIKNHQYTLNPDDYQWSHHSCHREYDTPKIWTHEKRKEHSERAKESWTPKRRKEQSERTKKQWTPERKKEYSENHPMKRPEVVAKKLKTMREKRKNKN